MHSDPIAEALSLSRELHRGQTRKGTEIDYCSHLWAVASLVTEAGGDEQDVIVALLHDAVEDQGGRDASRRIEEAFGTVVLERVRRLSDTEEEPKPPWRERKEAYLRHLRGCDGRTALVSAADKLHNARCILADHDELGDDLWGRFRGGREGTVWYYRSVLDALETKAPRRLVEELRSIVEELERRVGS